MPVSPATQREVEATMRTAPVVELTQAEIFVDTGAAMAAVPTRSEEMSNARRLREDKEASNSGEWAALPALGYIVELRIRGPA
jgi:hypothetical protein